MVVSAIALAALAALLAWPIPLLLTRANWPNRAPGTALILWQSIALAGGLSMIGALLSYPGLEPYGQNLVQALGGFWRSVTEWSLPAEAHFGHLFALSSSILLGCHLLLNLALTLARAGRSRRRHRMLIGLLTRPNGDHPDTRILDESAPIAYCLPGTVHSLTVLSSGLVKLLDTQQLRAVVAHEHAHAFQRHHLVLLAFRAWRSALPWFPIATEAHLAVATLVEMLADDQARRVVPDTTLAASIALVAACEAPHDRPGEFSSTKECVSVNPTTVARIARLTGAPRSGALAWRAMATTVAFALIGIPTLLLLAPALA